MARGGLGVCALFFPFDRPGLHDLGEGERGVIQNPKVEQALTGSNRPTAQVSVEPCQKCGVGGLWGGVCSNPSVREGFCGISLLALTRLERPLYGKEAYCAFMG